MKPSRHLALFALSALLAACGGGGDAGSSSGGSVVAGTTFALSAAAGNMVNLTKTGGVSISGVAVSGGQTINFSGSGSYSETTSPATFENLTAFRKHVVLDGTLFANVGGQSGSAPLSATSDLYFDSNFRPLGSVSTGSYCVTTSYTALPASATVGTSGLWYSQDCYSSSAKTVKIGSLSASYTLEADAAAAGTALLKVTTVSAAANGATVPATTTYRVTSAGGVTRLTDAGTATISGVSVTLTTTYQ